MLSCVPYMEDWLYWGFYCIKAMWQLHQDNIKNTGVFLWKAGRLSMPWFLSFRSVAWRAWSNPAACCTNSPNAGFNLWCCPQVLTAGLVDCITKLNNGLLPTRQIDKYGKGHRRVKVHRNLAAISSITGRSPVQQFHFNQAPTLAWLHIHLIHNYWIPLSSHIIQKKTFKKMLKVWSK